MTAGSSIPRVASLTADAFARDHVGPSVPVIATGALAAWPALTTWTIEGFAARFGDREVEVFGDFFDVTETTSFSSFCDRFLGPAPRETGGYVRWFSRMRHTDGFWADDIFDALRDDWDRPAFFAESGYVVPPAESVAVNPAVDLFPYRGLFISGEGGRTRLHKDPWTSAALLCQVIGRKHYLLYAPDQGHLVHRDGGYVDPQHPDLERFPGFRGLAPRFEGDLEPGEVLFLPSGWYHDVTTLSPSISITWNFVHELGAYVFTSFVAANPADDELAVADFFRPTASDGCAGLRW